MTPAEALAQYDAHKARGLDLVDPNRSLMDALVAVVRALVAESAAATAVAQPEVAENTGSGAAPVDPDATQAIDSAAQPPAAAGTAPENTPEASEKTVEADGASTEQAQPTQA